MLDFLLDIIFPRQCVACGKFGKFICDRCRTKIDFFDSQVCPYCEKPSPQGLTHPRCQKKFGLDGMFVLAHYRGPIRDALRSIKYSGAFAVASELAEMIGHKYDCHYDFDYLVPVPLSNKRESDRGFNQAEKLARELNKLFRIKLTGKNETSGVAKVLERTRDTKPQFDLKYEEREKNIQNAFALSARLLTGNLTGYSFCLVDDVATTGATIFECAKVLKKSGADKVWAICVARGG